MKGIFKEFNVCFLFDQFNIEFKKKEDLRRKLKYRASNRKLPIQRENRKQNIETCK